MKETLMPKEKGQSDSYIVYEEDRERINRLMSATSFNKSFLIRMALRQFEERWNKKSADQAKKIISVLRRGK